MPGYKKRYPKRRGSTYRPRRRTNYRKRRAPSNTQLSRQVRALKSDALAWRQYQFADTGIIRSTSAIAAAEPYHVKRLINPSAWTGVFQAYDEDETKAPRKFQMKNIKIRWLTQSETSTQTAIQCQIFVVSLKNASAQQFIQETSDGETLTVNEHYHQAALDSNAGVAEGFGLYFLNKAYFNIHYTKSFRFGAETTGGTSVVDPAAYTKTGYKHLSWNKEIKTVKPASFREMPLEDIQDTTRLYMYWFTNAALEEQFISVNCQIVGQTIAGGNLT